MRKNYCDDCGKDLSLDTESMKFVEDTKILKTKYLGLNIRYFSLLDLCMKCKEKEYKERNKILDYIEILSKIEKLEDTKEIVDIVKKETKEGLEEAVKELLSKLDTQVSDYLLSKCKEKNILKEVKEGEIDKGDSDDEILKRLIEGSQDIDLLVIKDTEVDSKDGKDNGSLIFYLSYNKLMSVVEALKDKGEIRFTTLGKKPSEFGVKADVSYMVEGKK